MKGISRFWARLDLILFALFVAAMFWASYVGEWYAFAIAVALFVLALVLKFVKIRCPHCNWWGIAPQWSDSDYCTMCGKKAFYSDEN